MIHLKSLLDRARSEFPNPKTHPDEIKAFAERIISGSDGCIELRAIGNKSAKNWDGKQTEVGFYNDIAALVRDCERISGKKALYIGLNPRNSALLHALPANQLSPGEGAKADDVPTRNRFTIDIDTVKPSPRIAATDSEIEEAFPVYEAIKTDLISKGIQPLSGFSGNGTHLIIETVAYSNIKDLHDKNGPFALLLRYFQRKYGNEKAKVDETTFDVGRVWKIYGTAAIKGANTKERPHRTAHLFIPEVWPEQCNIVKLYENEITEQRASEEKENDFVPNKNSKKFTIQPKVNAPSLSQRRDWSEYSGDLSSLNIVSLCKENGTYIKPINNHIHAVRCPWSSEHSDGLDGDGSTVIFESKDDGWPGWHCKHDHCHKRGLQDVLSTLNTEVVDRHCEKTFQDKVSDAKISDVDSKNENQSINFCSTQWEYPIALHEYDLPNFPAVIEPRWLGEFILAVSDSLEVPYELMWSFAFSVLSVTSARIFRVQVKANYFEPLNIWPCSALEPGNRKSAAFNICTEPLMQWQRSEAARMKPFIEQAQSLKKTEESIVNGLRIGLAKKKGEEREAIKKEISEIESKYTEVPSPPALWTSDCTPERLGVSLMENFERFGFLSDEGGIFDLLAGRYTGGVPNMDLFLKAHAGSPDQTSRMSRMVDLEAPALTIGISPQPAVLQDLANTPSFRGRGLLGRFLFTLPRSPLGTRTGETPPIPEPILGNYSNAIRRMLERRPTRDEKGSVQVQTFRLSPAAYDRWRIFWKETEIKFLEYGELETIKDWGSKLPGATARIAGLLHHAKYVYEAEPWKILICDQTMDMAIEIAKHLAPHALAVFGLMSADPQIESAKRVLKWIKTKQIKSFTQRDCHHALQSHFKRVKALEETLALLGERYFIRELPKPNAPNRTGRFFEVSPAVHGELL